MAQKLDIKIKGLYTSQNPLSEVPQGALRVAEDVILAKDSIAETRPGQGQFGGVLTTPIRKLFNYRTALLCHYDNKLARNTSGTWTDYSGTYSAPNANVKMRDLESSQNFYFTTDLGIKKIDSITATPRDAGAPPALDFLILELSGAGGDAIANDSRVAYRILFGYKDANNNIILGAPSARGVVVNTSGSASATHIRAVIPSGLSTSWFYQAYKSLDSGGAAIEPNDELFLNREVFLTSNDLSNGYVDFIDIAPPDASGAALYTNPSQQGIAEANQPPPLAIDMCDYRDHAFYAYTKLKHNMTFDLVGVDTENVTDKTVQSQYMNFGSGDVDFTSGSDVVTINAWAGDTGGLRAGMYLIDPSGTYLTAPRAILAVLSSSTFRISTAALASGTAVFVGIGDSMQLSAETYVLTDIFSTGFDNYDFTPPAPIGGIRFFMPPASLSAAETIAITARKFAASVNMYSSKFNAYYISGSDDFPGKIRVVARTFSEPFFGASATAPLSFFPELSSGKNVSTNDEAKNRIYIAKPLQPEAVPLTSYINVGSADYEIRRIVALRDSIFVLKDDGIFRITGEDRATFQASEFDITTTIRGAESAVAFNNQVFMMSDQGFVAVSDNGVAVMGRPVESEVIKALTYPNFDNLIFGVSYESARMCIFFMQRRSTDTYPTQAFCYNAFTNAWTRWNMPRLCGVVRNSDDKLYMGHAVAAQVYAERKTYTPFDYADEQYAITIASMVDEYTVTVASVSNLAVGQTVMQGKKWGIITAIDTNTLTVTFHKRTTWATGAAISYVPINARVQFQLNDVKNPGVLKQFSDMTFFFAGAMFRQALVRFATNFSPRLSEETILRPASTAGFGTGAFGKFPWGNYPFGGDGSDGGNEMPEVPIRTTVPLDYQRGHWLVVDLETTQAFNNLSFAGQSLIFSGMSERFK